MDPLSISAGVIAVLQLTNKVIECLRDVKDASKERGQCATEASSLYCLLTTLQYRIEDTQPNEPWQVVVRTLGVHNGPLDQYRQALEEIQAKITSQTRLQKIGTSLTWTFIKKDIAVLRARIERLMPLVQIALGMDHIKLSEEIKASMDTIRNDNKAIKHDTGLIREATDHQRLNKILEWISPTDFPAQQSDFISRRQEGTGLWFSNSAEYADWVHGANRTLFCPGIPGAGKTMIAAIAVDRLYKEVQIESVGLAYIYCSYKAQTKQTTADLLAAILKQLVHSRPSVAEHLERLYDHHENRKTRPSLEEIFTTLKSVLANYSRIYLVVDALDECSDYEGHRSQFLARLRDLQSKSDLRIMATSRFIPDIEDEFRLAVTLSIRAVDADIECFVASQMHRLPKCVQRDEKLQLYIQDKIVEAVDGMFLLARLHVDSLVDKRTKAKIQSTLERFVKGSTALDEAYDEAIKRIEGQPPEDSALAKNALMWITNAQRPLTSEELCHALAVEIGRTELDQDNIPDIEEIVSLCAGLVAIDQEGKIIRLVHYTTQEYFERIQEDWNPSAQQTIASTCLTYLCFDVLKSGSCPNGGDYQRRIKQNVFLNYAARYCLVHVLPVQRDVSELALRLLRDPDLVDCTVQILVVSSLTFTFPGYHQHWKKTTGLHLAARFGLRYIIEKLLHESEGDLVASVDSKDSSGRTPLLWAAMNGHEDVVRLLLANDNVDANSKDPNGRTPLSWAAANGHEAVARLLLGQDNVDADSKDFREEKLLTQGREAAVRLLLLRNNNVNANSKDSKGRTPLTQASLHGHSSVVKLLLAQENVDATSKDSSGRTPLSWAALNGHESVVRLLLAHPDVDPDFKGFAGLTPLAWAAIHGHEGVVELLLANERIDVDCKDANGEAPLSWAARRGHEGVVRLLLAHGVGTHVKDYWGKTPMLWAAGHGHEGVVRLIQEHESKFG